MKDTTIRQLELWLGRPLCAVFTVHRRLVDRLRRRSAAPPVQRILFIKLIEQGSTVLAYRALQRAVDLVGRSNVYFCAFAENREIIDILDVIPSENVITLRADQLYRLALDMLRALRTLRREKIDATIDMEFFARASALLAYLTGAVRRVGLHRFTSESPYRGDLMTHRIQHNPYLHTSQAYELLVRALTLDATEVPLLKLQPEPLVHEPPRFEPTAAERQSVRQLLEGLAGYTVEGPLVLLNPNAHDRLPLRRWPNDRFVALARRIIVNHPDATIAILGSPAERQATERLCATIGSPRVVSVAGRTSLREAVVLYGLADVLVTNDSGPAHFASMTDIDVVALFGPETPQLYGPLGVRTHVLWQGLACSPCVNAFNHRFSPCTDNVCMQAITVEQVYDLVARCLSDRQRTRIVAPPLS